jgi:putative holliday junction resolvase
LQSTPPRQIPGEAVRAFMTSKQLPEPIPSPILALDLGAKRVGAAISDPLAISITRLESIERSNWKRFLQDVSNLVRRFDAQTVVIGLPLRLDGTVGDAASQARKIAEKFALSLRIPVYLQDERLTSTEAKENLRNAGVRAEELSTRVDSEAAALILRDFLNSNEERVRVAAPFAGGNSVN